LADKYNAIVFVDECHATGFFGKTGRGTEEFFGMKVYRQRALATKPVTIFQIYMQWQSGRCHRHWHFGVAVVNGLLPASAFYFLSDTGLAMQKVQHPGI
jgi:hypothetical protein